MNDEIYELKEDEKKTEKENSFVDQNNGLIVGLVFILVGGGLLLSRYTGWHFDNWWALFILIPAVASLAKAWQSYQRDGRLGEESGGALMGGLFMVFIASVFLFGLSWGMMWPVVFIIIGVGMLAKAAFR
ncbi:MAG: hypothetical protein KDE51_13640 [Anaerolineales bacterium]|nr:hypothetical protein [Anaerolineales bacterium]